MSQGEQVMQRLNIIIFMTILVSLIGCGKRNFYIHSDYPVISTIYLDGKEMGNISPSEDQTINIKGLWGGSVNCLAVVNKYSTGILVVGSLMQDYPINKSRDVKSYRKVRINSTTQSHYVIFELDHHPLQD
jgi:hypothetical protein